jgi:hypothetical protein
MMVRCRVEPADRERLQRRTVRVLVAGQALGGAAIGVGGAVSPLLAKQILHESKSPGSPDSANSIAAVIDVMAGIVSAMPA